jgi:flagella basal body P-ring formation protein FlgA
MHIVPSEGAASGRTPLKIRIAERATVHGDSVTLGEIASFEPSKDPRVSRLKTFEVASAPAPGNTYEFNQQFLDYKVGNAIDGHGEEITLKTPTILIVQRTAQVITSTRMEEIFRDYLMKEAPWPEKEMSIQSIRVPGDIALPEGNLRWDIRENGNAGFLGNISATLSFYVDGQQIRRVPLSGRITITREVVQAAQRIKKGDILTENDVFLVRESTMRRHGDAITDIYDAVGKRATRSIRVGTTIKSSMVDEPPLVKKGSPVTIVAENEFLRISTLGEALEDGREGERIKVRNLGSGKEVYSTVEASGRVKVFF